MLLTAAILFMDQSEFSVAGATGNSNASVTAKSAVPFFLLLPHSLPVFFSLLAVHSRLVRSRENLERDCEQSMISVLSKPSPT